MPDTGRPETMKMWFVFGRMRKQEAGMQRSMLPGALSPQMSLTWMSQGTQDCTAPASTCSRLFYPVTSLANFRSLQEVLAWMLSIDVAVGSTCTRKA